jgi:hypothetical protein
VKITAYVDASHGCDLITRRSVTGILLCVNKTPVKWYCKRQNTIESSTYGAELVAARIAVEMIMEFRYKLRMMGIKVEGPSVLLADNEAVVKNTTLPSSTLKKKHNAIAYHKVREAVAANIIKVAHIRTHLNVADILTKPLSPQSYYSILRMILFKRDSSDNQGELQQVQQHTQGTSTAQVHAELTNRTVSDSQALSRAQESATEHDSSVEQQYPEG